MTLTLALLGAALWLGSAIVNAGNAPSGAIFTTLSNGSEVNLNNFPSKEAVYLDGGPGPGAPQDAAGLDDGTYVFQVTDPSGKTLLSTDPAACREFTVVGGIITGVVPAGGCEHMTGLDIDHGATTVQLMPYLDTPNNGGVYKVWATMEADYLSGCAALGQPNGLSVVDCGYDAGTAVHGFIPSASKTDNFKVKQPLPQEIDTQFVDDVTGTPIDGLKIKWTDPVGASNTKWSYYAPSLLVNHEAHVEDVTAGTHNIQIDDQAGCRVYKIQYNNKTTYGASSVAVKVSNTNKAFGILIKVFCH